MERDKEWIEEEIEKLKKSRLLILVEGVRDKSALETLGLTNIVTLHGRPLYEVAESIKEKEIVLLMDLDSEGRKLYGILNNIFSKTGIKVNDGLRKAIAKAGIKQVEGMASFMGRD